MLPTRGPIPRSRTETFRSSGGRATSAPRWVDEWGAREAPLVLYYPVVIDHEVETSSPDPGVEPGFRGSMPRVVPLDQSGSRAHLSREAAAGRSAELDAVDPAGLSNGARRAASATGPAPEKRKSHQGVSWWLHASVHWYQRLRRMEPSLRDCHRDRPGHAPWQRSRLRRNRAVAACATSAWRPGSPLIL